MYPVLSYIMHLKYVCSKLNNFFIIKIFKTVGFCHFKIWDTTDIKQQYRLLTVFKTSFFLIIREHLVIMGRVDSGQRLQNWSSKFGPGDAASQEHLLRVRVSHLRNWFHHNEV